MAKKKTFRITKATALKVLQVVDAGLVHGIGNPVPGHMCVEAAVSYAMGYGHSDQPKCVTPAIRTTKITVNDAALWEKFADYDTPSANKNRAKGMRRLAIAQLGSAGVISDTAWTEALQEYVAKRVPHVAVVMKEGKEARQSAEDNLADALADLRSGASVNVEVSFDPSDYEADAENLIGDVLETVSTQKELNKLCEDLVKIMIKLGSPGTKFLYLTKGNAAKILKQVRIIRKAKKTAKKRR